MTWRQCARMWRKGTLRYCSMNVDHCLICRLCLSGWTTDKKNNIHVHYWYFVEVISSFYENPLITWKWEIFHPWLGANFKQDDFSFECFKWNTTILGEFRWREIVWRSKRVKITVYTILKWKQWGFCFLEHYIIFVYY